MSGENVRRSRNIAAGILVVAGGLVASAAEPSRPAADPDPARFDAEIQAFESWDSKNAVPRDPIVFVGSSSIRLWRTAESFSGLPVVNRGFGGSHISDVNHYVDRTVLRYRPRVVVFYAGDNDIADGKTPERVVGDFQEFVAAVRRGCPEATIIYLPIKPSRLRWALWPQLRAANELVAQIARSDERLIYVDTATPLLGPDGRPKPDYFLDDGLHLNAAGYEVWSRALRPFLSAP